MKSLNQSQLALILNHKNLDLPVPRLETRNFYQYNSAPHEYKIYTYYMLVFEPLVGGKIDVSIIDSSVATIPISRKEELYIGWRREGDMLNLMTQLNLRAFIVDHKSLKSKELRLSDDNCPNGLKTKAYSPIKK